MSVTINLNGSPPLPPKRAHNREVLFALRTDLYNLRDLDPQPRGYTFENFLKRAVDLFDLKSPRAVPQHRRADRRQLRPQ